MLGLRLLLLELGELFILLVLLEIEVAGNGFELGDTLLLRGDLVRLEL